MDKEAAKHALAVVGGTVNNTGKLSFSKKKNIKRFCNLGVGGLTVGGGYRFLTGKHGLVIDNLVAAELVTSNGEVINVDATRHSDLFWAIRGLFC